MSRRNADLTSQDMMRNNPKTSVIAARPMPTATITHAMYAMMLRLMNLNASFSNAGSLRIVANITPNPLRLRMPPQIFNPPVPIIMAMLDVVNPKTYVNPVNATSVPMNIHDGRSRTPGGSHRTQGGRVAVGVVRLNIFRYLFTCPPSQSTSVQWEPPPNRGTVDKSSCLAVAIRAAMSIDRSLLGCDQTHGLQLRCLPHRG